jgi:hypothetical protein
MRAIPKLDKFAVQSGAPTVPQPASYVAAEAKAYDCC